MSASSEADGRAAASRLFRWGQPILALALLSLYLPTLARSPTFSDGPELVTAIWTLGVPHPTGYPLFVLLAHAFTRLCPLPVAPCVEVELFNALCAVGAAIFTARATRAIALLAQQREPPRPWLHAGAGDGAIDADLAGLAAGFLLGIAHLVWEQVRIPEVYPLHLFLVTWAGYLWVRFEITRREVYIAAAALPMGLGLAHHVTMVYFLPAAALYLLARRPGIFIAWLAWPVVRLVRRRRAGFASRLRLEGAWAFPVACLIGALPLLLYSYLIWANAHTTGVPWNDVSGWKQLVYHATGKQYSGFLGAGDLAAWWARIAKIPGIFDKQFLPPGTALLLAGVAVLIRRAGRLSTLLFGVILFNVGHGVYYAVGDYGNYYIPALFPCAAFMGAGLWWILRAARARSPASRRWLAFAAAALLLCAASVTLVAYARLTRRVPAPLARGGGAWLAAPLAILGLGAGASAIAARRRARRPGATVAAPLPAGVLPGVIGGGLAAAFVPVSIARAAHIGGQVEIGGSYGAEVVATVPRGAVLLTQGDGFLFNMWYQHHVLDQGLDFATLDVGTLHAAWYHRYLRGRYPSSCDPLAPAHLADPDAYRARCGTFALRMARGDKAAWVSFGRERPKGKLSRPEPAPRPPAAPGAEVPPPPPPRVVRGGDPRCEDRAFRAANAEPCRCFAQTRPNPPPDETCVFSAEEGGVVPRAPVELYFERIIRRHIDERPIFERNAVTFWVGDARTNPRRWSGPAYQRLSAEYTLLNRGRVNQVVYTADLAGLDPCAGPALRRAPLRAPKGPRPEPLIQPYRPNDFPTLLTATYLAASPAATDDDATRAFSPGDTIHMNPHWFEQFRHDPAAQDGRGAPIRHGLRVCVFDPAGARVSTATAVSGRAGAVPILSTSAGSAPGEYTVQACSVGEVGEGPVPEGAPCQRLILEYTFTLGEARSP